MKVLVRPQLHDGFNEAVGLVAGVVALPLGDDLQHRSSVVLLTVGRDVRPGCVVNNSGHGFEQSGSNPGRKGLNRERRDPSQFLWKLTISLKSFVDDGEVFPKRRGLLSVLKTCFDDNRWSVSDVTIPVSSEDNSPVVLVGFSSDQRDDRVHRLLHGSRFFVFGQLVKVLDLDPC